MKRRISLLMCIVFLVTSISFGSVDAAPVSKVPDKNIVKNVILVIPDGTGLANINLGRWYGGGKPLTLDSIICGLVQNYPANYFITDSAAAATALSTGRKTTTNQLGILPSGEDIHMPLIPTTNSGDLWKPVPTVIEGAKLIGKSTGLVFKSEQIDATPAGFASHVYDRHNAGSISEQMVYNGVDVVFGGGSDYMIPGEDDNNRKDGEDLIKVLKNNGYDYVTTRTEMLKSKNNKIWGLFGGEALSGDLDRVATNKEEPSLPELTDRAIKILSKNDKGFFLMVEASEVDWYAHDNDPVGVASEVVEYDKALKVALDFAKKDGHTAVVTCADHSTGGMYLTTYNDFAGFSEIMHAAKHTTYYIEGLVKEDKSNLKQVLLDNYGLTEEDFLPSKGEDDDGNPIDVPPLANIDDIKKVWEETCFSTAVGLVMAKKAEISFVPDWYDHTPEEIVLGAYHPNNFLPTDFSKSGLVPNTDIAKYISYVLGINLSSFDKTLWSPLSAFTAKGATVKIDKTDAENIVFVITKGSNTLKIPVDKNLAYLNGKLIKLNAVTTYIKDTGFVSSQAVGLIK